MTIEYTYPEPPPPPLPTGAQVPGVTRSYALVRQWNQVELMYTSTVDFPDVPLVCEAMMTLAGHEWPVKHDPQPLKDVIESAEREVAERIVARLGGVRVHSSDAEATAYINALQHAIRIVREECGVAEAPQKTGAWGSLDD